jgi:hypothetical protein
VRDILPMTPGDFARLVQPHLSMHDFAQEACRIPRTDRHEMRPRLGIVIPPQTNPAAMVSVPHRMASLQGDRRERFRATFKYPPRRRIVWRAKRLLEPRRYLACLFTFTIVFRSIGLMPFFGTFLSTRVFLSAIAVLPIKSPSAASSHLTTPTTAWQGCQRCCLCAFSQKHQSSDNQGYEDAVRHCYCCRDQAHQPPCRLDHLPQETTLPLGRLFTVLTQPR